MRNGQFGVVCGCDADGEGRGEVFEAEKAGSFAGGDKFEEEGLLLLVELVHYAPERVDKVAFGAVSLEEGLGVLAPIADVDLAGA